MKISPLGKPDFGPLERACDSALKSISVSLEGNLSNEASELLGNLASAIRSQREEVLAVFTKEFALLEAEFEETTAGVRRLLDEELPRLQGQLEAIPSLIEREKARGVANASKALEAIPIPEKPKAPDFHPGGELINTLMGLDDQQDTRHQRTSGNIWENWKQTGE